MKRHHALLLETVVTCHHALLPETVGVMANQGMMALQRHEAKQSLCCAMMEIASPSLLRNLR
jgi:hypothetical protein